MADFRIARRDAALVRAERFQALAERGGDAAYDVAAYQGKAARAYGYASWVDSMIKAHPYQG